MASKKIKINRAPVMTLWAAVVAERLGHNHDTALTLGKAVAGLNAQSKGQRLGIFEKTDDKEEKGKRKEKAEGGKKKAEGGKQKVEGSKQKAPVMLLGRAVPTVRTKDGIRAVAKDEPITPQSVQRYLDTKFRDDLADVQEAMEALAKSYKPAQLEAEAFALYVKFRPTVPEGEKGWGAKADLDLGKIRALAK
jgi:hypothetical protein